MKPSRARQLVWVCGLLLTALMAAAYIQRPPLLAHLDNALYDALLKTLPASDLDPRILIVDLDEASLAHFGQWPWPRGQVALLLEQIKRAGASLIALDILFAEKDRTAPEVLDEFIAREIAALLDPRATLGRPEDGDRLLAAVLKDGPFILGYEFRFDGALSRFGGCLGEPPALMVLQARRDSQPELPLFHADGLICPLPEFAQAALGLGFFNISADADGVQRRAPLLITYEDRAYPSLGLVVLLQLRNERQLILQATAAGIDTLRIGERRVPMDRRGNLLLNFGGATRHIPYLSAGDVLLGKLDPTELAGKIVLIGTSAAGLEKKVTTPLGTSIPGIEVHATLIENLLHDRFLAHPAYMPGVELLLVLALGLVSSLVFSLARLRWSLLLLTLSQAGLWSAALAAIRGPGIFFSPLAPAATQVGLFSLLILLKFILAERLSRRQTQELAQAQNLMLQSLSALAEIRDSETGGHILRTQRYLQLLCEKLAAHPRFENFLDAETVDLLVKLAPLHDIGKVGIPDSLLRKPGQLSAEEYEKIKEHTRHGLRAIQNAQDRVGSQSDRTLSLAKDLVYSHHEWWNGEGYPEGLEGERIPIPGRLMAVVDVYDALVSKRVYKEPVSHAEALAIIAEGRGRQFDPDIADAFLAKAADIQRIARQISEQEQG